MAPGRVASAVICISSLPKRRLPSWAGIEPRRAGERGLPPEDAVELDRVADRLVDLQGGLARVEDDGRDALGTGRRRQQRLGLLGHQRRRWPRGRGRAPAPNPACRTGRARRGTTGAGSRRRRWRWRRPPRRTRRCAGRCGCPRWTRTTSRCPTPGSWRAPGRHPPRWRRRWRPPAGRHARPRPRRRAGARPTSTTRRPRPAGPGRGRAAGRGPGPRRGPPRSPPRPRPGPRPSVSSGVAWNPQDDPSSARTPMPAVSVWVRSSTTPLRAAIVSWRTTMTRASAYRAPAASAASTARDGEFDHPRIVRGSSVSRYTLLARSIRWRSSGPTMRW